MYIDFASLMQQVLNKYPVGFVDRLIDPGFPRAETPSVSITPCACLATREVGPVALLLLALGAGNARLAWQ